MATERMFSLGNKKLGKMINFNLPPVASCPGATEWCKKHCYAQKGYLLASNIQQRWKTNLELTKRTDFVDIAVEHLNKFKQKGHFVVRIHPAGDFYSQEYLNKWFEIARRLPDIRFVAYTRSWMLDFSDNPGNMLIYYSVDPTTRHFPKQKMPLAFVPPEIAPHGTFFCPYPKIGCSECMFCYRRGGNVAFKLH